MSISVIKAKAVKACDFVNVLVAHVVTENASSGSAKYVYDVNYDAGAKLGSGLYTLNYNVAGERRSVDFKVYAGNEVSKLSILTYKGIYIENDGFNNVQGIGLYGSGANEGKLTIYMQGDVGVNMTPLSLLYRGKF